MSCWVCFCCSSRRRHTRCALVTGVRRVLFRLEDFLYKCDKRLKLSMNISHENIDETNAGITVDLAPDDYNPQVDKAIKEQAKKAKLPGFRPGMVPASHIRRTFGKAILIDEVNRVVSDKKIGRAHV